MFDFFSAVHTVFTGILLQALPFMLLGSLVSSGLHILVPQTVIVKIFPKKYGLGFLTALFAGLLFPVCECASVPMMRALIKKGVAMPIAVSFMLASPIINPVSIISTLYAFPQQPMIAVYRVYFGLSIAFGIGLILLLYPETAYLKNQGYPPQDNHKDYFKSGQNMLFTPAEKHRLLCVSGINSSQSRAYGRAEQAAQGHSPAGKKEAGRMKRLTAVFLHTGTEFFTTGPFLIIGAFITALIRTAVPPSFFSIDSSTAAGSLLLMMLFAFLFSACSSSDAFIVRVFLNRFPLGAIIGFLVYGPMMDLKNLFMLLSLFKKRFVIELTLIITVANGIGLAFFIRLFL